MGIFKARKSDLASGPDIPIDQIIAMKAQGYSNNQIIQTLQRDGYTSSQIFDAMSQSEMAPTGGPEMQESPMPMGASAPLPEMSFGQMPVQAPVSSGTSEEMIEAIIDEKWNELVRDINKVIEWKAKADAKLMGMEQQMTALKEQFDKLHQALIGKIGDYDKHMLEVGAELQAMEKVFSKVLPTFVDNVNELGRITDRVKNQKKSKTRYSEDED